jgi:hypothetical protein
MAQQYDPRKVLKHISKNYLKSLFDRNEASLGLDWGAVVPGNYDSVYEAWRKLPTPKSDVIEAILGQVDSLATGAGVLVLRGTLIFSQSDAVSPFDAIHGSHDRALWVYLNHRDQFIEALLFAEADQFAKTRYWDKRADLPELAFIYDPKMKESLEQHVSLFYKASQGRGEKVVVEHYERSGGRHYFFAYVKDYADFEVSMTEEHPGERVPRTTSFETCFVYSPKEGVLEIHAKGGKKVVSELGTAFGEAVLGIHLSPPPSHAKCYKLEGLKDEAFNFVTEPQDAIKEIRVRYLRFDIGGYQGRKLTLEAPIKGKRNDVYGMMRGYLTREILEKLVVGQARIQMEMHAEGGKGEGKRYSLELSLPYRSNLKSKSDKEQELWGKYLKKWEIDP